MLTLLWTGGVLVDKLLREAVLCRLRGWSES